MEPYQVLLLWVRVNLRVMAMKRNSIFPKAPRLEPHHQMQFSVITRTLVVGRGHASLQKCSWSEGKKKEKIMTNLLLSR